LQWSRSAHGLRLDFRRFIFGRAASSAGRSGRSSRRGRGRAVPAGCDPQDTARLADTIAEKTQTELFNVDGSLFQFTEGRLIAINKDILRNVIARHIVSLRLVNRASTNDPHWEIEYDSFEFPIVADTSERPDQQVLLDLITALSGRVAKEPSEPCQLTPQQQREIRDRVKMGEPKDNIARAYNVDVATVRQLAS
jgi:hypothetical protein